MRLEIDGRLQLLDVHEEAAVAAHRDDPALGVDELGRDGRGQREAHGGVAVRDQHRVGLVGGEGARHRRHQRPAQPARGRCGHPWS